MPVVKSDKSIIRKNSTGSEFIRRRINLIEGSNVTLTVADDAANNEVDVTIASSGGGGGGTVFIDQSGGTSDTYGVLGGLVNGSNTTFTVSNGSYDSGTLKVYLNGQLQTQGSGEDWVETTPASGTFDFNTAPQSSDEITVVYGVDVSAATNLTGWADYADTTYTSGSPLTLSANTDTILENDAGTIVQSQKPSDISSFYSADLPNINYDAETGNFTVGLTVTGGTSGATGVIESITDNGTTGTLYLSSVTGTFQNDETITDTSTGSATTNGTLTAGKILGRNGDAMGITIDFKAVPQNPGAGTYIEVWIDIGGTVGELYRRIQTFPKGAGVERNVTVTTSVYTLDTWEKNGGIVYVRSDGVVDIYDIRFVLFRQHKAN